MSSVRTGALSRSIAALAFDHAERMLEEQEERDREGLAEYLQQFQVPVEGTLGGTAGWTDLSLEFDVPMLRSPPGRRVPYDKPTYAFGAWIKSGIDGIIVANIRKWIQSEEAVEGALMRVGAYAPGATNETAFSAEIHMTFQGYGAPFDDISDLDEPVVDAPPPDFIIEEEL